jgi:hypothetical protein
MLKKPLVSTVIAAVAPKVIRSVRQRQVPRTT